MRQMNFAHRLGSQPQISYYVYANIEKPEIQKLLIPSILSKGEATPCGKTHNMLSQTHIRSFPVKQKSHQRPALEAPGLRVGVLRGRPTLVCSEAAQRLRQSIPNCGVWRFVTLEHFPFPKQIIKVSEPKGLPTFSVCWNRLRGRTQPRAGRNAEGMGAGGAQLLPWEHPPEAQPLPPEWLSSKSPSERGAMPPKWIPLYSLPDTCPILVPISVGIKTKARKSCGQEKAVDLASVFSSFPCLHTPP